MVTMEDMYRYTIAFLLIFPLLYIIFDILMNKNEVD